MLLVFRPGLENGIPALHPGAFVTTWASAYTYNRIQPQLTVNPIKVEPSEKSDHSAGRWGGDYAIAQHRRYPRTHMPSFHSGEDGYFRGFGPGPFYIQQQDFIQVAHGLWTLLLAYLGGHISLAIYRRRPAEDGAASRMSRIFAAIRAELTIRVPFRCIIRGP